MQPTTLTHGRGWLDQPAAASLARMDTARGDWLRTTSTGRTRAEQADAYRKYQAGGSYAAKPGYSPHEPGLAADFHVSAWTWLLTHGEEHGWFLTISSEPWHRVYRAAKDQHRNDPAPTGEEEDDMYGDADRTRDVETHQAIWNDTRKGGGWPGVIERLDRIEANDTALAYTLDGREVPAAVSAAQGGPRVSYWRRLGRALAAWKQ